MDYQTAIESRVPAKVAIAEIRKSGLDASLDLARKCIRAASEYVDRAGVVSIEEIEFPIDDRGEVSCAEVLGWLGF